MPYPSPGIRYSATVAPKQLSPETHQAEDGIKKPIITDKKYIFNFLNNGTL